MSLESGELQGDYPDGKPRTEQPQWRTDFPVDVPEDDELSRREFAKFLVLTSGAFLAGQCWIGVASLLRKEEALPAVAIKRGGELPVNGHAEFHYPTADDPCLLLRLADGKLVAYGQKCPHLACAVTPELDRGLLRCPCHNGAFEAHEGRPIAGPPRRPLPLIRIEERKDGWIYATGVELRTV